MPPITVLTYDGGTGYFNALQQYNVRNGTNLEQLLYQKEEVVDYKC